MNIHQAFRIRKGFDVWETLADLKLAGQLQSRTILAQRFAAWMDDADMMDTIIASVADLSTLPQYDVSESMQMMMCSMYAKSTYIEALANGTREGNLTVGIEVRKLSNRYYLIPHCSGVMGKALDFMHNKRSLEDYSYWQMEGTPPNISPQAWLGRKKVWTRLLDNSAGLFSKRHQYMLLDVLSLATYDVVDPFMAAKEEAA